MSRSSETDIAVPVIVSWWRSLYPDEKMKRRGDAGARAAMRRAGSPFQVLLQPACHVLLRQLRDKGVLPGENSNAELQRIAIAAAVICECRNDQRGFKSLCEALGAASDDTQARLSPLRFQALMVTMDRADGAEQLTALRRALAHVKDTPFDVRGLVWDILHFSDDTRIRWTFDYYGTRREAPAADPVSEETLS